MPVPQIVKLARHAGDLDDDGHDTTGGGAGAHIADATDAHDASAVSFAPAAGLAATDVQGALEETAGDVSDTVSALAAHLADTTDAHDASAISVADAGTLLAATEVEGALQELAAAVAAVTVPALDDLTDVTLTSPAEGEYLRFASGEWVNQINDTAHVHFTERFVALGGAPETFTLGGSPIYQIRVFVQGVRADPDEVGVAADEVYVDTVTDDIVVIDYEVTSG